MPAVSRCQPSCSYPLASCCHACTLALLGSEANKLPAPAESRQVSTVFQMSGPDKMGALAEMMQLLQQNGCTVTSAAVRPLRCCVSLHATLLEHAPARARHAARQLHTPCNVRPETHVQAANAPPADPASHTWPPHTHAISVHAASTALTHHPPPASCPQVWTQAHRMALVFTVSERGQPLQDDAKLARLQQMLMAAMDWTPGEGGVQALQVGPAADRGAAGAAMAYLCACCLHSPRMYDGMAEAMLQSCAASCGVSMP